MKISGMTAISIATNLIALGLGLRLQSPFILLLGTVGLGLAAVGLITDQLPKDGEDR